MKKKKTLILGSSDNPTRYSFLALQRLKGAGHPVEGIGKKDMIVDGIAITKKKKDFKNIDTVTLYLNPAHQPEYYDYIFSLHPNRIIFNPGTENPELKRLAAENDIQTLEACTLVLLSTGQF